mgnify:FL=1
MRVFFIILLLSNSLIAKTIQPLSHYTFEELLSNEEKNHYVIEGCVSLYSAITELIKTEYPDLASTFFEIANTIYPYGIISLKNTKNISYEDAEKSFFENVNKLSEQYIDEMNINGKKNGSYFKGSFIGDDLLFCNEITKYLQFAVLESLGK